MGADAPPKAVSKILFLDGLRGLAAMLVVACHAGYMKDRKIGPPAVDTFFVLSAFLLTLIFEKKAEQLFEQKASYRRWALALGDYFARRFLRVYPLFAIVAVVLAMLPDKERGISLQLKQPEMYSLPKVLVFTQHWHILWTLPIEISYYFFIPILVVIELRMRQFWWLLTVAGYVLVFYNGFCLWGYRRQHGMAWPHYPTFVAGSLAAMIYSRLEKAILLNDFKWKLWVVVAIRTVQVGFLLLLLSDVFDGLLFKWVVANPVPDAHFFVSFNVTVLIVCEMLMPGPISSVLEWSLLRYAGQVSFSMYLTHVFVVYYVPRKDYYERFFLLWTLVFLLSTACYYAVERPCQLLAGRIGRWVKKREASVDAVLALKEGVV